MDRRISLAKQRDDFEVEVVDLKGSSLLQAQQQAVARIGQKVQTQAAYLAYIDVFWALMLIIVAAIPLALALRNVKLGGPAPVGH